MTEGTAMAPWNGPNDPFSHFVPIQRVTDYRATAYMIMLHGYERLSTFNIAQLCEYYDICDKLPDFSQTIISSSLI